ncbi:hypothetical protein [Frondihabitans australicus]|uniref:Uncharacterized protein n=1 Tax=Frondihabitans australicus TaxID=386892 RepID=A0A495IJ86_9MICO|nr:hypothetical protein [Frondihabitans australicus]RKR76082.1 hypothetical protein C8E83_3246 [Frondihabitans australicus]
MKSLTPLAVVYAGLSVAAVAALAVLTAVAPHEVSSAAWIRGVIVALTSLLTLRFAVAATRRRPRALLRLRIVSVILIVAFAVVLFVLPLPAWMVVEQLACLVVLAGLAVVAFRARANA